MSPPTEPMTVEDLSSIYRKEKKGAVLSDVRKDLYKAMANLITSVNREYERQMGIDPDSLICEGADQRRKKVKTLVRDVIDERMRKIAMLALRGSMGADNNITSLTTEEREYYNDILNASKGHLGVIDGLRGVSKYIVPDITEQGPPVAAVAPVEEPVIDSAPVVEPEECIAPVEEAVDEGVKSESVTFEEPEGVPATEVPEDAPEEIPAAEEGLPMDMGDDFSFEDEPETEIPDDGFVPDEATVSEAAVPIPVPAAVEPETKAEEAPEAPAEEPEPVIDGDMILLRMLEDMPTFSGPTRDYTLKKEDIVLMPSTIAAVLMNREKAVMVKPTP